MFRRLALFVFIVLPHFVYSQYFELHNPFSEFFLIRENEFGTGLSSFDVDEDGWDDYTVCSWNTPTRYFRNVNGELILTKSFPNNKDATACVWSDLDNDGKNDLIVVRRNAKPQLWWQEENFDFTLDTSSLHSDFLPTNSPISTSIGDYNRDGNLDVIITNYSYNFGNRIFTNLGNRMFQLAPFGNINYNGVMSFQASWIDIDYDLYPELYIVNDHDFHCELYEFTNEYEMTNITGQAHLENPSDAMSNSWTDFDNDGDFDVFTSNGTNQTNFLCINSDGVFTNIGPNQGLIYPLESWGGLWLDIDNNGWQDLLVCTNEGIGTGNLNNKFFLNEGGNLNDTFIQDLHDSPIGYHAAVRADIDNNGTSDIFISPEYYFPNASLNLNQKKAFLSVPNSNHYIKFRLKGRWSNRNGIGSRYEIFAGDVHYVGFTQAGEGYLSQNTQNIICGIGENLLVDSLFIYWPSGIIDKHYDMQINTAYLLEEGETNDLFKINPNSCLDSLNSIGSVQFPILLWPDQSTANPYETSENNLTVLTNTGFGNSVLLNISIPEYIEPQLITNFTNPICEGQNNGLISSLLIRSETDTISEIQFDSLFPGTYLVEHEFDNGCVAHDTITLDYATTMSFSNIVTTPSCWYASTGEIRAEIEGGSQPYNNLFFNDTLTYGDLPSGPFHLIVTDANNCSVDSNLFIFQISEPEITIITDSSQSPTYQFQALSSNSESTFNWNNSWNGSNFTADISLGLEINLHVTDDYGCITDTIWYIQQPASIYDLGIGTFASYKNGIAWLSNCSIQNIHIYDLTGRCVRRLAKLEGNTFIPMPPQTYLIHVKNRPTIKIVVQ